MTRASADRERERPSLLQGIAVLGVAGFVAKLLGAIYRIPLTRLIGAEGVGIYQLAYPMYTTLLSLSRAGIPVAVSKLIAEYEAKAEFGRVRRVFQVSAILLTVSGLAFSLILGLGSPLIARWLGDTRAALALLAVAPAITVVAMGSAFRGYFQGLRLMTPSATADIVEQFVRVAVILLLAWFLSPRGVAQAAAGATFGAVAGALISLLYLGLLWWRRGRHLIPPVPATRGEDFALLRRVLALGIPVAAAALALPVMGFLDAVIVQNRLQAAGFSVSQATTMYGRLTGLAMTLVNLPAVLATAISANMVPWVAEAQAAGNAGEVRRRISLGIRASSLFSVPATVGLLVLATPIMRLLYGDTAAGPVLAYVSPVVILLNLYLVTTSILQGMGKQVVPIYHVAAGAVAKLITSYVLTAMPTLNVKGAALGSVLAYGVASFLNLRAVLKEASLPVDWQGWALKPVLCSAAMVPVAMSLERFWPWGHGWGTLVAIGVAAAVYGLLVLVTGAVTWDEMESIPGMRSLTGRLRGRLGRCRVNHR